MSGYGSFGSLWHNEWDKVWRRKRVFLLVAWVLVVFVGGFLTLQAHNGYRKSVQDSTVALTEAIHATLQQLQNPHLSAKQKRLLENQLTNDETALRQEEASASATVSARAQLAQLTAQIRQTPAIDRPPVALQIALDRYRLTHGVTRYPANLGPTGWSLAGGLLAGLGLLLFALIGIVLSSDAVAGELQDNTLPMLFLHAAERRRIWWAKALAGIVLLNGFMAATALGLTLFGGLLVGFGSPTAPNALNVHYAAEAGSTFLMMVPSHWVIVPQWAYDALALVAGWLTMSGWTLLVMTVSTILRSVNQAMGVMTAVLLSGFFLSGSHGQGWQWILVDPSLVLSLIALSAGTVAQSSGIPAATLTVGAFVWIGWAVLAIGVSLWRFPRLEP